MTLSSDNNYFDLIVIGGGASGLACVVGVIQKTMEQGKSMPRILLIEKNIKAGKKLIMTGNGRCNVTHRPILKEAYHGSEVSFCHYALEKYGWVQVKDFFSLLGLDLIFDDQGRAYPYTLHSGSVLDCLRFAIEDAGVQTLTSTEVKYIEKKSTCFELKTDKMDIYLADAVVLATGGACAPQTGSNGGGYALAESLGHKTTEICPGIVQIKTENSFTKKLAGLRFDVQADIYIGKDRIRSEKGELLFTDYGVSGPVALQLSGVVSRYLHLDKKRSSDLTLKIDFLPDIPRDEVLGIIQKRIDIFPERTVDKLFAGLFVNRLSIALIRYASAISMSERINQLDVKWVENIAQVIKSVSIPVRGVRGLNEAQVTIGGINTSAFSPRTMESNFQPGFYAIGEVLDIDGDCGGYNLQWAWSSALIAADAICANRKSS